MCRKFLRNLLYRTILKNHLNRNFLKCLTFRLNQNYQTCHSIPKNHLNQNYQQNLMFRRNLMSPKNLMSQKFQIFLSD